MPSTVSWHRVIVIASVFGLVGVAACSSQRPAAPEKPPIGESVPNVGSVVVSVSEAVPADSQQRFAEVSGALRLHSTVQAALMRVAKLDPQSPRSLEVRVTQFRLRSASLAFWGGPMSGVDYLDVKATVRDGDRTVREYTTGAATTGVGTWIGQDARFEKLVLAVAERVADQL
jgi:hypothetical protein